MEKLYIVRSQLTVLEMANVGYHESEQISGYSLCSVSFVFVYHVYRMMMLMMMTNDCFFFLLSI